MAPTLGFPESKVGRPSALAARLRLTRLLWLPVTGRGEPQHRAGGVRATASPNTRLQAARGSGDSRFFTCGQGPATRGSAVVPRRPRAPSSARRVRDWGRPVQGRTWRAAGHCHQMPAAAPTLVVTTTTVSAIATCPLGDAVVLPRVRRQSDWLRWASSREPGHPLSPSCSARGGARCLPDPTPGWRGPAGGPPGAEWEKPPCLGGAGPGGDRHLLSLGRRAVGGPAQGPSSQPRGRRPHDHGPSSAASVSWGPGSASEAASSEGSPGAGRPLRRRLRRPPNTRRGSHAFRPSGGPPGTARCRQRLDPRGFRGTAPRPVFSRTGLLSSTDARV